MAQIEGTAPGPRCDCALRFESWRAIYEHVVQTGHLKARTCMPCHKVFGRTIDLEMHQQTSQKHQKMLGTSGVAAQKTTVNPSNGQDGVSIKANGDIGGTPTAGKCKRRRRVKKGRIGAKRKVTNDTPSSPFQLNATQEQEKNKQTIEPRQPHPFWFMIRWRKQKQKKKRLAQAKLLDISRKEAGASTKEVSGKTATPRSNRRKKKRLNEMSSEDTLTSPSGVTAARPLMAEVEGGALLNSTDASNFAKEKNISQSNKKGKKETPAQTSDSDNTTQSTTATTTITTSMASSSNPQVLVPPNRDYRASYPWTSGLPGRGIYPKLRNLCLAPSDQQEHECYRPCTPGTSNLPTAPWLSAPPRDPLARKPFGVALDCEMVEVAAPSPGQRPTAELARLCVADLVSGAVLIDAVVRPTRPVTDWRTRHSGVSAEMLAARVAAGEYLDGWRAARGAVLALVDRDTILAGHALHHDLGALGVAHAKALDTSTLAARHAFPGPETLRRRWGLGVLMREVCGVEVQGRGALGHDCVEDALATRELALACARDPERMREWGREARERFDREEEVRRRKQREKVEKERRERREREEREEREWWESLPRETRDLVERNEREEKEKWERGAQPW
ncbi:hypothetical protein F4810DRAFT_713807 [Camillea tinctor]|nr:hypothetical protein F4810DRAFT_713807 [Camillea tinctor]